MTATAVPISTANGVVRMKTEANFISSASIFLPRYSGRPADHQSGDEDAENGEHQYRVHAGADAAGRDLAELYQEQRHEAAERHHRIVHGVDGAAGGRGRDRREERRGGDAEAGLLALHVAARLDGARDLIDALLRDERIAVLLAVERQ